MKKVLFLPFLQLPSGHHQVVSSLSDRLTQASQRVKCESVDILSYTYKNLEPLISSFYLKWIKILPALYHWMYEKSVYQSLDQQKRFRHYEILFLRSMRRLIHESNPDFIVCSHALPSYLTSRLKENGDIHASIINVYTDYFIHHIWGVKGVDAHFISIPSMSEYLVKKGVKQGSIYYTGIPIHPHFQNGLTREQHQPRNDMNIKLLVSGGSLGVGKMDLFLSKVQPTGRIIYYVLCGNNKGLYTRLLEKKHPRIKPFPYIYSKEKLNELYHLVDGVLTKPGGVTISECLYKKLPILIYDNLPGQEKINVGALMKEGLLTLIDLKTDHFEKRIEEILLSENFLKRHSQSLEKYHSRLSKNNPIDLIFQQNHH